MKNKTEKLILRNELTQLKNRKSRDIMIIVIGCCLLVFIVGFALVIYGMIDILNINKKIMQIERELEG